MKRALRIFGLTFVVASAILWLTAAVSGAAPSRISHGTCGGQDWPLRDPAGAQAPVSCFRVTVIDGVSVRVDVNETASGFLTVTYHLAHPVHFNSLVHVVSHLGASSAGGPQTDPKRTIPAGGVTAALVIPHALCGQVDIRWKHDNSLGRVAGPWINNDSCKIVPTTTTTTTTTIAPSTTTSTTSTGPTSAPTVPPSVTPPSTEGTSVNSVPGSSPLPPTGSQSAPVGLVGGGGVALGSLLIFLGRRRNIAA